MRTDCGHFVRFVAKCVCDTFYLQYFIELSRIRKVVTHKGGVIVLEEYGKIILNSLMSCFI